MADPLSIASGCVGVLTAAAQITSILIKFTKDTKNAPDQARVVLAEVSDINGILSQLQSLLLRTNSTVPSSWALLQVDHLVSIISGCVLTFSELQKVLDNLKVEGMNIIDRIQWSRKESFIASLIQRLQTHKASLSLIIAILNG